MATETPHRTDPERLDDAFAHVERARFLPAAQRHRAGFDGPISIGMGSTCSQPSTVREMLSLLDVRAGMRVLDVGSGSGWTAALLGHLVGAGGSVVGVELVPDLVAVARTRVAESAPHIRIEQAERGALGRPSEAPFDRVLVSADATDTLPTALVDQVAPGGLMVIPVRGVMTLVAVDESRSVTTTEHGRYRFVPLRDEVRSEQR